MPKYIAPKQYLQVINKRKRTYTFIIWFILINDTVTVFIFSFPGSYLGNNIKNL